MLRNLCTAALLAVMLVVFFTGNAQAQQTATQNVTVAANVLTALSWSKSSDVSFGNVWSTSGGAIYLDPKAASSTRVGSGATVGALSVTGSASTSIRLGWPLSVSLSDGASHTVTYTLAVNGLNANTQASSTLQTLSGGYVPETTGGGGAYYLWIGGDIGTLTGQVAGNYTGSVNITADYN